MRIGSAGSGSINILQSDVGQFRNEDFFTDQGTAYIGEADGGLAAGQFSRVQAHNPVGSGIIALVDEVWASMDVQMAVTLRHYDTPLTSNLGSGINRKLGLGSSWVDMRTETSGVSAGFNMGMFGTIVNGWIRIPFIYPIQLAEGKGIILQSNGVNVWLQSAWFFREI